MSTIRSSDPASGRRLEIKAAGGDTVWLAVDGVNQGGTPGTDVVVPTSAVLAAVATECGALVIPRADLPEVTPEKPGYSGYVEVEGKTESLRPSVEWYDAEIRRLLAVREYVAAHPPVNEAQVEAMARLIGEDGSAACDIFRRLLATGQVSVRLDGGAS